jgi:formate--tetrahydrofolate ligase
MSDIEIARKAKMLPIREIALNKLNMAEQHIEPYGHTKAKVKLDYLQSLPERESKLILVTAISPTPAGEGKTTTTVGLGDGLNRIGKNATVCLREPSLGPCFGIKGGAAGGGYAQVVPMEDINLHFTGDFHAITSAHNLLSAAIDNHIHWGNALDLDVRRIQWRRVLDMNDRALRNNVVAMGGKANGYPRETGFDITVASEIMAILCLATSRNDLQERLGNIVVGFNTAGDIVRAKDLKVTGAMSVLLKSALEPNLVQTLENNPAFIHGGPFANIAHGCNSMMATKAALKISDYVVTEAGFGADLGAEKFLDIKCRAGNLKPAAVVIVATVRALKMHGGVPKNNLTDANVEAVKKGLSNLGRHIQNIKNFGLPVAVALNAFITDTEEEIQAVKHFTQTQYQVETYLAEHWAKGSAGVEELSNAVVKLCEAENNFDFLYDCKQGLFDKINHICKNIYGASEASASAAVQKQLKTWEEQGYGDLPICMAKTPYSFSTNEALIGAPNDHVVEVREVRLSAGAGFVVAICGSVMTMPGLPRVPSAEKIGFNEEGQIVGLF